MKLPKNLGIVLLGVWLLLTGLIGAFRLSFANIDVIMALLALATGIVILLQSFNILKVGKSKRSLGMILVGVWLILSGASGLFSFTFAGQFLVMALLALVAGGLLLLGR